MALVRFLFGHGWWILWHLAFYAVLFFFVVLILLIFAQELKSAGQPPDKMSLGSIMIFMVGIGLGIVTLVNMAIYMFSAPYALWMKWLAVIVVPALVMLAVFPLNHLLAEKQSYPVFWMNVVLSLAIVIGNLVLMWKFENRPVAPPAPGFEVQPKTVTAE